MTNEKIMYEVLFGFLIWNTNICLISRIFDNASMVDKTGVKNYIFGWGSSYPKMKFLAQDQGQIQLKLGSTKTYLGKILLQSFVASLDFSLSSYGLLKILVKILI